MIQTGEKREEGEGSLQFPQNSAPISFAATFRNYVCWPNTAGNVRNWCEKFWSAASHKSHCNFCKFAATCNPATNERSPGWVKLSPPLSLSLSLYFRSETRVVKRVSSNYSRTHITPKSCAFFVSVIYLIQILGLNHLLYVALLHFQRHFFIREISREGRRREGGWRKDLFGFIINYTLDS